MPARAFRRGAQRGTLSLGEFNLTWMLHTPLTKTLPVGLADSYASMRLEGRTRRHSRVLRDDHPPAGGHAAFRRCRQRGEITGMCDGRGVALRLEACAKTFPNGTRALEAVTLHVDRGETVVFLGPSGCGKTTLLRIIAGLEGPDAGGRVFFNGNDVTDVPIERRNVGMVFQSYALFPNMSVAENIGYGLKIRGMSGKRARARITELMELTGIGGGAAADRPALGRTTSTRSAGAGGGSASELFLLDEPPPRSTPRCASGCAESSIACCARLASPPSTSPTIRPRQWRLATASWSCATARLCKSDPPAASILNRRADLWRSSSAPPTSFRRPWRTDMLCFPEVACACRTARRGSRDGDAATGSDRNHRQRGRRFCGLSRL
jgi:ABC-type ATPase involved in cell division